MTARPGTPGPDTGSYEVIHLGGQAAVVVPVSDFLRLRVLEQAASPEELEDAEDTAAVLEWKARDSARSRTRSAAVCYCLTDRGQPGRTLDAHEHDP